MTINRSLRAAFCGFLVLALPGLAWAEAVLPPGFMPLNRTRVSSSAIVQRAPEVAVLRADGAALPGGFMPISRTSIRPLTPSRGTFVAGSVHMIGKKNHPSEAAIIIDEKDPKNSALNAVGAAERELAGPPQLREVARHISAKVRHVWPLPPAAEQEMSSAFGMRRDPFTKQPRFHEGMDIAAVSGTPVLASADGVVDTVASGKHFGNYVSVKHRDGSLTTYGHLSVQLAHEGQRVKQGQKLGEVGSTGRSTGAHLHFQLEEKGRPINPMAALTPPSRAGIGVAMRQ